VTTQAEALYHLQEIELAIQRKQKRLGEIASALNDNQAVLEARSRLDTAEQVCKPLRTRMRALELELQSNVQKTRATEDQLYSGAVKNPKDLQGMQQEIEALKKWHGELENRLLELMLAVEEADAALTDAQANLANVTTTWESEHQDLLTEKNQLEQQVASLQEDHAAALKSITPESLKAYNALKPRKANQPVALLEGHSCAVCGVEQTSSLVQEVRQGQKLVTCTSCGRILVAKF
jgi:predicted  nucleic acid-binding Zn-ribbon protein